LRESVPGSCAFTCASATTLALGVSSLATLRTPLSRRSKPPRARPPSPPIVRSRCSRETLTSASLGQTAAQRLLQLHFSTHGHTLEQPFLANGFEARFVTGSTDLPSRLPDLLWPDDLPLSKKGRECREPRKSLRNQPCGAARTPQRRPRRSAPDRGAACGRRHGPTIVCGDGRWTTTLDCAGRVALSEGPPSRRLLPQDDEGEGSPPQVSFSGIPVASPILRPEGWMLPPSSGIDRGPHSNVTPRRATLSRRPGCLSPLGIRWREDRSSPHADRHPPLRRRPTLIGSTLQPAVSAPLFPPPGA